MLNMNTWAAVPVQLRLLAEGDLCHNEAQSDLFCAMTDLGGVCVLTLGDYIGPKKSSKNHLKCVCEF